MSIRSRSLSLIAFPALAVCLVGCTSSQIVSWIESGLKISTEAFNAYETQAKDLTPEQQAQAVAWLDAGLHCVEAADVELASTHPPALQASTIGTVCALNAVPALPPGKLQTQLSALSSVALKILTAVQTSGSSTAVAGHGAFSFMDEPATPAPPLQLTDKDRKRLQKHSGRARELREKLRRFQRQNGPPPRNERGDRSTATVAKS